MEYQKTLKTLMKTKNVTVQELAKKTKTSPRWIDSILVDPDWNPWLSTIIKLSEALGINAIQFVEHAEVGYCGREPRTQYSGLTPKKINLALRTVRLDCNLSQTDLVKITHFQLSSISLRENERYKSYPCLRTLEVYCSAYNMSVSSFLAITSNSAVFSKQREEQGEAV